MLKDTESAEAFHRSTTPRAVISALTREDGRPRVVPELVRRRQARVRGLVDARARDGRLVHVRPGVRHVRRARLDARGRVRADERDRDPAVVPPLRVGLAIGPRLDGRRGRVVLEPERRASRVSGVVGAAASDRACARVRPAVGPRGAEATPDSPSLPENDTETGRLYHSPLSGPRSGEELTGQRRTVFSDDHIRRDRSLRVRHRARNRGAARVLGDCCRPAAVARHGDVFSVPGPAVGRAG